MPSVLKTIWVISTSILLASTSALQAEAGVNARDIQQRDLKACPALDNYIYTTPRGTAKFRIRCDVDTSSNGNGLKTAQVDNLEDCMNTCNSPRHRNQCDFAVMIGNVNKPGTCYMKQGNGGKNIKNENTKGHRLAIRQ